MKLRVVTWNMNHNKRAKERAWDFLRNKVVPDIALVQEAHLPDSLASDEQYIYPDEVTGTIGASVIWNCPSSEYRWLPACPQHWPHAPLLRLKASHPCLPSACTAPSTQPPTSRPTFTE